jgi:antagonist of KipI
MSETIFLHFDGPGLHTTVQDLGRPNYQSSGIPLGGALDRKAAIQANYLVGNSRNEPVLEITLLGPKIVFLTACQIALTGADLSAKINDQTAPRMETVQVQAGDVLKFGKPQNACRAYLAVGGSWQVKKWLGSASWATQHANQLTPESKATKDLKLKIMRKEAISMRRLHPSSYSYLENIQALEVLPGPEFEVFDRKIIARFFAQAYQVSSNSNRMGYRLEPALESYHWPRENISSGIVPGTIQMTNEGQAIVLLADAQTIGGYPRIANLTEESLYRMAQLKPGSQFRFALVDYKSRQA